MRGGERDFFSDERWKVIAPAVAKLTSRGPKFVAHVEALGMRVVIPSRANRKHVRTLDRSAYVRHNAIERWFGRLKAFRRIATRYDKTSHSYLKFVATAACLIALTGWR